MTSRPHTLAPADADALKLATRLLVGECGGLEAAASACRLNTTSLSDAQRREHPERWLPLDVVAALEVAGQSRAVTEALARRHGCVLVPVDARGPGDLAVRLAALCRASGGALAVGMRALSDSVVTDDEREELRRELMGVVQTAQQALGALGLPHGPAIVKGGGLG